MSPNVDTDAERAPAHEAEKEGGRVLTTMQARQGSPRRANLRVLIVSLVVLAAIGLAMTTAYWSTAVEDLSTPAGMAPQGTAPEAEKQPPSRP